MDNFTLAVVIGQALMIAAMIALILLDKKTPRAQAGGKRPA